MTVEEMRTALSLGPEVSDIDVVEAYAEFLLGTAQSGPIITAETARWHLSVDGTDQDDMIADQLASAQDFVERYTGQYLTLRPVTEIWDTFERLTLRAWPIAADAVVALTYRDNAGDEQAFETFRLDVSSRPGRLLAPFGGRWPIASTACAVITATFLAGYASADEVPATMKRAVLVLLGGYFADREGGEIAQKAETAAVNMLSRAGMKRRTL